MADLASRCARVARATIFPVLALAAALVSAASCPGRRGPSQALRLTVRRCALAKAKLTSAPTCLLEPVVFVQCQGCSSSPGTGRIHGQVRRAWDGGHATQCSHEAIARTWHMLGVNECLSALHTQSAGQPWCVGQDVSLCRRGTPSFVAGDLGSWRRVLAVADAEPAASAPAKSTSALSTALSSSLFGCTALLSCFWSSRVHSGLF